MIQLDEKRKEPIGKAPMNLPFSPGLKYGEFVFVSGQGPIDKDGKVVQGDITVQTKATLDNFRKVVQDAGSSMGDVVQITVYLSNLDDYKQMNEAYSSYFPDPKPARAVVRAELLFGMKVEIQGIAAVRKSSRLS